MPNKDRNKRSVRKARAAERERLAEAQAASAASADASDKKVAKAKAKAKSVEKTNEKQKTGFLASIRRYFSEVRTEMHRVTWPSRTELRNWSVAVIVALIVFGVCVWAVDTGFVALLVGFTGLRG